MLRRALLLPVFLTFIFSTCAIAEFYSGSRLKGYLEEWESGSSGIKGAIGAGYVVGVYDARAGIEFCAPSGVTVGQIASMVLKHLRETPDKLHLPGDIHVVYVLSKAWPCAPRQQGNSSAPSVTTPVPQPSKPKSKPREESSPF